MNVNGRIMHNTNLNRIGYIDKFRRYTLILLSKLRHICFNVTSTSTLDVTKTCDSDIDNTDTRRCYIRLMN